MSSRQPDFKAEFQQNMTQLDSIKTDIERKITEKTALSNQILPQLQDINRKLAGVLQKFNLLKGQLSNLEKTIQDKDQGISDAGNQCIGLQDEIARLKQELAQSKQQQQDLEQTYNIRFQELTEEKDKMRTEQEQMKQMIAQLKAQEENLKQQILDCEERYRRLEGIMTQLSNENQELKQQHMALTQKIKDIRGQIDNLIAADTVNPKQITDLLAEITKIIDEINNDSSSGNNSSGVLGGIFSGLSSSSSSGSSSGPSVGQQMGKTLDDIYGTYNANTLNNVNSEGMSLRQIIGNLYNKPAFNKDGANSSKYSNALNAILRLKGRINSSEISNIFRINRITDLDEDQLEGGKRSKKLRKSKKTRKTQKKRKVRKQKGGFEYSGKSKRRRLTVPRSTSSQRSSSQRSSSQPRSTYESQSIVPQKYKARGTKKSKM